MLTFNETLFIGLITSILLVLFYMFCISISNYKSMDYDNSLREIAYNKKKHECLVIRIESIENLLADENLSDINRKIYEDLLLKLKEESAIVFRNERSAYMDSRFN